MVQAPEDYEVRSLLINALLPFLADSVVQQLLLVPNDCWSFIQLYIMQWLSFIPSTFVSHQLDLSLDQLSERPVHSTLHNWGTHLQCCQCCHIMWVEKGKCKSPSKEKYSVTREISSIEAKREILGIEITLEIEVRVHKPWQTNRLDKNIEILNK